MIYSYEDIKPHLHRLNTITLRLGLFIATILSCILIWTLAIRGLFSLGTLWSLP